MNLLERFAVLIIFSSCLHSCAFSVPQVENAFRQVQSLVSDKKTPEEVWLASYKGRGAVLKPYAVEGYTVFANESGDAVAFDGWVVRSVLGFGLEQAVTISDDGWVRSARSGEESFVATCSQWQKDAAIKGYQWRQNCGTNGHKAVIHIDEAGNIRAIQQAFGGDLGTLTLSLRH